MSSLPKRLIGQILFAACENVPRAKPYLAKWGMRTRKEWFGDRVVGVQTPEGRRLNLASFNRNHLSFELFWKGTGYYEPITTLVAQQILSPDDTFLDVGANIGFYTLVLAVTHPGVHVIAFEPNPRNFAMLERNVQASGLGNVRCEPAALSDVDGTATLYLSESDMSASLRADFEDRQTGTTSVETVALDSYLRRNPVRRCALIKVDVEGHELAFFHGAAVTIAATKPDIIAEVTQDFDPELVSFLAQLGYRFYPITNEGLVASEAIGPVIRGRFVFLNYLISAKPPEEIARVFAAIAPRVRKIDLRRTSKYLSPEALERFARRSAAAPSVSGNGRRSEVGVAGGAES